MIYIYIKFDKVVINTLTVVCNKGIVATVSISPGVSGDYLRHIFTIYLKFKWINYEAEFSSILIMKHA